MEPDRLTRNAGLFVAFRVLFNARFYYPVLAVFFVDLGLTVEQYTLLNVAWAASIVLCELPLGALGDLIGCKPLVVAAAAVMVIEMGVLSFVPTGNATVLFWVLLVNRVLSGAAEAAASGADEALAYDSLKSLGQESSWPDVLSRLARSMSVAMMCSMLIGAAVYDPKVVGAVVRFLGLDLEITQATTVRFPAYLTFGLAIGAFFVSLRMIEAPREAPGTGGLLATVRQILAAGRWIVTTPFVLGIVSFSLVLDPLVRIFLTITSTYFRMLSIPAVLFGPLTAAFGALGFFVPGLARALIARAAPLTSFGVTGLLLGGGLFGLALAGSWMGVAFVVPMAVGFHLLGFFVSHYLNQATPSDRRATVLSFRSLAGNLTYGGLGWGFALLLRAQAGGVTPLPGSPEEEQVLGASLIGLPVALAALSALVFAWASRIPRMRVVEAAPPG